MTISDQSIAILILAAGSSSRMGTPKQLLPWKSTTLLGHTIETAKAFPANDIFVVLGASYKDILPSISNKKISIVKNNDWRQGLGTSIAAGIRYIIQENKEYGSALILLCDQPLISENYLNEMVQAFVENYKGIVATTYSNGAGVPVIFDRKYFAALENLMEDKGAKAIINKNGKDTILLQADGAEIDLDTKVEYEQLSNRLKG